MPDIGLQITGETGEGRDENGRFVKGSSGNPAGRPRGSGNAATRPAAILLDGEAEALTRKAIEMALAGDVVALRLCLDRIMGQRRGRPVDLDLPSIDTAESLGVAAVKVAEAAVQGAITPEEAMALCQTLERCGNHLMRKPWEWRMWFKKPAEPGGGVAWVDRR